MNSLTRRSALLACAAAAATPKVLVRLSRFTMKESYARLEAISPRYRLLWNSRFFGFRLTSITDLPYDSRISYSAFGSWEVGGVDLVCRHYFLWPLTAATGAAALNESPDAWRLDYPAFFLHLSFDADRIHMTFEPRGTETKGPLLLRIPGNLVFDKTHVDGASAAYYASGLGTGLAISGEAPGSVAMEKTAEGVAIVCRIPTTRASSWTWTVLGASDWPAQPVRPAPVSGAYTRVKVAGLPEWERAILSTRGWDPSRGRTRERVAGLFVCAEGHRYPISWMPEARMEEIASRFLPKVIASRRFTAVGLSRDGITEQRRNADWLKLVAQAHRGGLRVYMKPGDGELIRIATSADAAEWAKASFDVPEEQRCDVVRLPAEAVVHPWVTANLCLEPQFYPAEPRGLAGQAWPAVRSRLVASVADRFSRIVEAIRKYAPQVPIDLESCDTGVLDVLLARHENLGVMYMLYGEYPEVTAAMDLYSEVARRQMKARRVVLETDCYYSRSITGLGKLQGRLYKDMYSTEDLDLMQRKHRHVNSLGADAAWAWGINITWTEAKFRAVCEAV